jgi:hypothetical protein
MFTPINKGGKRVNARLKSINPLKANLGWCWNRLYTNVTNEVIHIRKFDIGTTSFM